MKIKDISTIRLNEVLVLQNQRYDKTFSFYKRGRKFESDTVPKVKIDQ